MTLDAEKLGQSETGIEWPVSRGTGKPTMTLKELIVDWYLQRQFDRRDAAERLADQFLKQIAENYGK